MIYILYILYYNRCTSRVKREGLPAMACHGAKVQLLTRDHQGVPPPGTFGHRMT